MSFAKSKTKRFNDIVSCAPPPGAYDPKQLDKVAGAYIEKGLRFKQAVANENEDVSMCSIASYGSLESLTPRKTLFQPIFGSEKKIVPETGRTRKPSSTDLAKQREIEAEMKRLVLERNHFEKSIHSKEDDMKKLDGRLQQLQKDKTALEANIATLKKEVASLKKSNDSLKQNLQEDIRQAVVEAKRPLADNLDKLKADQAQKELRIKSLSNALTIHQSELDTLKQTSSKLQETLKTEIAKAVDDVQKPLLEERQKLLSQHEEQHARMKSMLDTLETNLQDKNQCNQSLEQYKESLQKELNKLKESLMEMRVEKFEDQDFIRHLKGEVFALNDELLDKIENLDATQCSMTLLELQIQNMHRTDERLNKDLGEMTAKCNGLEENIATMEKEAKEKEDLLKQDLTSVQESFHRSQQECESQRKTNTELALCLAAEQKSLKVREQHVQEVESCREELDSNLKATQKHLMETHELNLQLQNDLQSVNWDKGCLEGELSEAREIHLRLQTDQVIKQTDSESRMKDIQGQMVMLRDMVDNKQIELNEAIQARLTSQTELTQMHNNLLFERRKNQTREFLLQEQEKENCRELERAQKSERDAMRQLEGLLGKKKKVPTATLR